MKSGHAKCSCGIVWMGKPGWKWTKKLGLLCPDCARLNGIDPDQFGIKPLTKGTVESYGN